MLLSSKAPPEPLGTLLVLRTYVKVFSLCLDQIHLHLNLVQRKIVRLLKAYTYSSGSVGVGVILNFKAITHTCTHTHRHALTPRCGLVLCSPTWLALDDLLNQPGLRFLRCAMKSVVALPHGCLVRKWK